MNSNYTPSHISFSVFSQWIRLFFISGFLILLTVGLPAQELLSFSPVTHSTQPPASFKTGRIVKKSATGSMYEKGVKDADRYYADYTPYAGGFVSGMVLPPAGLVTTIIISSKPPKEFNLGIPNENNNLKSDPEYFRGYLEQATKKKKQRTWAGFATGTAFFVSGMLMFGYLEWK